MNLLAPAFLWTLAALLPLAAIYFLKVKPRKKPVTAFFLWQKVFAEKKSTTLFKRLRDVFSLLLMALAFTAVALALAEPDFAGDERRDLLIVVDHSASMSARDGASSRLDRAKDKAKALIKGMNGSQRAAVASFAMQTRMVAHPTRHRKSLLEAVDSIQATQLPSRVDTLRALVDQTDQAASTRVILITDGCLDSTEQPPQVEVLRIDDAISNVGIGRGDLRSIPGGPARLGLFLLPVAALTEPVQTEVVLTHVDSNKIVKLIPVTLNPGENPGITLTLDDAPTGRWKAEIAHQDALPLDNTAFFYVPLREPIPVVVQGDDPYFFQNVVGAFERSDQLLTLATDPKSARLLLGIGNIPRDISSVVFHPPGEEIASAVPMVLAKDHPLLRYIDAEAINFTGARKVTPPEGSLVLMADENGQPLIYLTRTGEHSTCVVNLDPVAAQFYLSAWFPVLIHNAVAHLTRRADQVSATLPTGSTSAVPGQDGIHGPLLESGFHAIGEGTLAASLVAPQESRTDQKDIEENAKPIASGESPSYWLLVLAIGVLVGESILYHRRKVG